MCPTNRSRVRRCRVDSELVVCLTMKHCKTYILVSIGVLVYLFALFYAMLDMAPFRFLRGYAHLDRVSVNGLDRIVCIDTYLSQTDFNTICLEATAELGALRYVEIKAGRIPNRQRLFRKLDETGNICNDSVRITVGDKYNLLENSNNPKKAKRVRF